jgi:hypothetical protein
MPGSASSGQSHSNKYFQHVQNNWGWTNTSNPGVPPNSAWSVSTIHPLTGASAIQMWLTALDGPGTTLPAQVLDFPGCSPIDFSMGGGTFMFVADNYGTLGPYVQPEIPHPSGNMSAWDYYRKTHNYGLVSFTLEESYYGVGLPGTETIDWFQGIASAAAMYPQYSTLIDHPSCQPSIFPQVLSFFTTPLTGWGGVIAGTVASTGFMTCLRNYTFKKWQDYNMYPSTFTPEQQNAGKTKCSYFVDSWIEYMNIQYDHVHKPHPNHPLYTGPNQAAIPNSYSGLIYNQTNGNLNKFWMYKYLRLNSKAHFMQSASPACGCNPFLEDIGWHLLILPPSAGIFPFNLNGNTYSKAIDPNFQYDRIHTLMSLYSSGLKTNKKRINKLLNVLQKDAPKESYYSEEQLEAWFRNYIINEDKI